MPGSLEGKVAVVTGVSHASQVGQAVAKDLAAQGAALVICARTQANVEARATELREEGARVHAVAASLTEEPDVLRLIDETLAAYSRIDILVNLAGGLTLYKPAVEFSLQDWNRELNNNLLSAFLVSRAAFPHMAARDPSEFQKAIRTEPGVSGASRTSPSAPTPSRRSQS